MTPTHTTIRRRVFGGLYTASADTVPERLRCARVRGCWWLDKLWSWIDCDVNVGGVADRLGFALHSRCLRGGSQGLGMVRTEEPGTPELVSHSNPALSSGRNAQGSLEELVSYDSQWQEEKHTVLS